MVRDTRVKKNLPVIYLFIYLRTTPVLIPHILSLKLPRN